MSQVKRNMIQVRLNDEQFSAFNKLKKKLDADNNADAIRKLIDDKQLISGSTQENLKQLVSKYDDLSVKLDSLMWDSRNLTNNMNQLAHAANAAKDADPSNVDTWNWIIVQLQNIFPSVKKLSNTTSDVNNWLKESRGTHGSVSV